MDVKNWTDAHPNHGPILILIEPKNDSFVAAQWDVLDQNILSVFPITSIVTPDDVRGSFSSVQEAITTVGWPAVREGKLIFGITGYHASYIEPPHTAMYGRVAFLGCRNTSVPEAAILVIDDPTDPATDVSLIVEQGYIVRTLTDENYVPGATNDANINNMYYFIVIDIDGNDLVSESEVERFFTALGADIPVEEVNLLFGLCGATSGNMTFSEFGCGVTLISQRATLVPYMPNVTEEIQRQNLAIQYGAQWLSTDYPGPPNSTEYYLALPDTTYTMPLYRCNPVTTTYFQCDGDEFENSDDTSTHSSARGISNFGIIGYWLLCIFGMLKL